MRALFAALVIVALLSTPPVHADAGKDAAIRELIDESGLRAALIDATHGSAVLLVEEFFDLRNTTPDFPESVAEETRIVLENEIDTLVGEMIPVYAKHMSEAEIRYLTSQYRKGAPRAAFRHEMQRELELVSSRWLLRTFHHNLDLIRSRLNAARSGQ